MVVLSSRTPLALLRWVLSRFEVHRPVVQTTNKGDKQYQPQYQPSQKHHLQASEFGAVEPDELSELYRLLRTTARTLPTASAEQFDLL